MIDGFGKLTINPEPSRRVDLNRIKLKNRFLVASGALEYGRGWPRERPLMKIRIPGYGRIIDPSIFGAVITKTLTLEPRIGNYIDPFEFEKRSFMSHLCRIFMSRFPCHNSDEKRVLQRIPGGWRNDLGWWNVGIDYWIKEIYPTLKNTSPSEPSPACHCEARAGRPACHCEARAGRPPSDGRRVAIIPNIGGFIIEHYTESIKKLNPLNIVAIELNISCTNVESPLAKNSPELVKLFTFCKAASAHPLIVKLGVDSDYIQKARIAEYCGINAVSAINSVPVLGGGYSGRGIKYIALKAVSDLKEKTGLPVIGGGGIYSWKDCQEFFEVGADAVTFGSVHFFQPWKPTLIVRRHQKEVERWIKKK